MVAYVICFTSASVNREGIMRLLRNISVDSLHTIVEVAYPVWRQLLHKEKFFEEKEIKRLATKLESM